MTVDTMDGDRSVDERALRSYLSDRLGETEGFEIDRIEEGSANETFRLKWGDRELILRRPPIETRARGLLHGIAREYDVLSALAETWVPTPDVVTYCEDEDVLGDEFYVMERLDGAVLRGEPERFGKAEYRRRVGMEILDALAKLHDIDYEAAGLNHLENPEGHVKRHLDTLADLLDWAEEITTDVRTIDRLHEVREWLYSNAPATENGALIHGDYRPANIMFAPGTPPRIAGILDWEMSTLGEPLTDLGWLLAHWHEPRDPSPLTDRLQAQYNDHDRYPAMQEFAEEYSRFMAHPDYPTRRELVTRYEKQTAIEFTNERFFRALGAYKLAVILEGFFRRAVEGSPSAKDSFPRMRLAVPVLAEQAGQIIDGETPL